MPAPLDGPPEDEMILDLAKREKEKFCFHLQEVITRIDDSAIRAQMSSALSRYRQGRDPSRVEEEKRKIAALRFEAQERESWLGMVFAGGDSLEGN